MNRRSVLLGVALALFALPSFAAVCPRNIPIGNCAPKSGTATNFTGDTGPMRTRKSIFALNATEIKELRLAFAKLRALPDTDPRRWLAQANVHCWNCSGDSSTKPDVHGDWAFMPWHRVYLYTLEKILGELVGNPKFALPYWDWNTPDDPSCTTGNHRSIPPPYFPQTTGGTTTNSLWDCYRDQPQTSKMPNSQVGKSAIDFIINNYDTFDLFFGKANQSAALWPGPHGYVHVWTADHNVDFDNPKQDMGVLESAARDPLFWAHHANFDRLWDVWIAKYGVPSYPQAFLDQNWTFWNQQNPSKLIRMSADDAANRATRLKYQYAKPSCKPEATFVLQDLPVLDVIDLTVHPNTVVTTAATAKPVFKIREKSGTKVVLHLEDVTVPSDQGAVLRVYLNHPNATAATSPEDPRMIRELIIVPSRTPGSAHAEGHRSHSMNFVVVIPNELAREVEAANGEVPITIVPVTGRGEEGILEATPKKSGVRMKKPFISVE